MADGRFSEWTQGLTSGSGIHLPEPPSIGVQYSLQQTVEKHGLSPMEVKRLTAAMAFLRQTGWRHVYVVAGDGILDLREREARHIVRTLKSHIALYLRRAGLPAWYVEVIEASEGFHSNLVFPWYDGVERLRDSSIYGLALQGADAIQPVHNWQWLTSYLAGERVSKAQWSAGKAIGPRTPGTFYLETEHGGDRVKPSAALKSILIETGWIPEWRRSYAKPLKPEASKVVADGDEDASAPKVGPARPVAAAPLQRTGPIQAPPMVPIIEDDAGQLGFVLGEPIDMAAEADKRRKERGLTQGAFAASLGIARPTFANGRARRYRLSDWALSRVADFLRSAA